MFVKLIIVTLLFIILYCLGSALYYMLSQKRDPKAMAKALSWRIGISIGVFLLLLVGFLLGFLHPHGVGG